MKKVRLPFFLPQSGGDAECFVTPRRAGGRLWMDTLTIPGDNFNNKLLQKYMQDLGGKYLVLIRAC